MGKKKIITDKDRSELLSQADELLSDISDLSDILTAYNTAMGKRVEEIKAEFEPQVNETVEVLKIHEKALTALMKKNAGVVFDGEERVDLKHGALLFAIEKRVVKAKGVLEKVKQHGFRDAIKTVESVDWDTIEKWPVEKLALVGTKRQRKEVYSWEIKDEHPTSNVQL